MSIGTALRDTIKTSIEEIGRCKEGSEEYEKQVRATTMLIDRYNEMEKIELEKQKVEVELEKLEIEEKKNKDEKTDKVVKNILTGGGLLITALGTVAMFIFEEKGSITSQAGRKILDRVFRTK